MRKFNLLILSSLMVLCLGAFTACNDDDDDNNKPVIAGQWKLQTVTTDVKSSLPAVDAAIEAYVLNKYSVPASDAKLVLTLTTEGQYTIKNEANIELERGTYKYEKGVLALTVNEAAPKATSGQAVIPVVKLYAVDFNTTTLNLKADVLTDITSDIKEEGKWVEIVGEEIEMPANFKLIASSWVQKYNVVPQPK